MLSEVSAMREDYNKDKLEIDTVHPDPFYQFEEWFQEAKEKNLPEPNAMTLATANKSGIPSARIVLLKGVNENGFIFYTNYDSRKGEDLAENPHAALVFLWHDLQRQIRIEGSVEKISEQDSISYFKSRPKGSQLGAWASPQSQLIESREVLENNVKVLKQQYESSDSLPKPPNWGGYCVKPSRIEFWQGRSSRLHDRIVYSREENNSKGAWNIKRLAP